MMRAKIQIFKVEKTEFPSINIQGFPVTSKPFDENGFSEDNTYSKWTPTGNIELSISNPVFFDKFKVGQQFYLDFTEVK